MPRSPRIYEAMVGLSAAIVGLLLTISGVAFSEQVPSVDRACERKLSKLWPQWQFPKVMTEVHEWARSRNEDPTVSYADFDGDKIKDVAFLVQATTDPRSIKIAVCLSSRSDAEPLIIDEPYCSDGITHVRKGQQYYDFETGREGQYPLDGVHVYCFEKAGATYIFTNGVFRRIVDSD